MEYLETIDVVLSSDVDVVFEVLFVVRKKDIILDQLICARTTKMTSQNQKDNSKVQQESIFCILLHSISTTSYLNESIVQDSSTATSDWNLEYLMG